MVFNGKRVCRPVSKGKSVLVLVALLTLAASPQDPEKAPAPSAAEQGEAEKMVKDVFKAEYAKRGQPERQAFAKQLLAQALQSKDDLKVQFVLLREARDIATQGGDAATALSAVDELARRFTVDAAGMRMNVLSQAAKAARTYEDYKTLVSLSFKLIDAAVIADDYELADKLAASALQYAKKAQDLSLTSRATARIKEIADLKSKSEKLRKARETLEVDPSDGSANLLVGQFLCSVKGDWEKGLPMLAKGTDQAYAPLAQRELSNPTDAPGQLAVGDGWWDLSEKEPSPGKERFKDHAGIWYAKAFEKLSGLSKTKVEKRLAECRVSGLLKGTWVDVTDPKLFNLPGKPGDPVEVAGKPGSTTTLKMQFPKGEYDGFTARVTLDPNKNCAAFLIYDGPNSLATLIDAERAFFANAKGTGNGWNLDYTDWWTKEPETVITVLLTNGEYIIHVNGKEKTRMKTTKSRIEYLGLEGRNATIKFDQIKLRRAD